MKLRAEQLFVEAQVLNKVTQAHAEHKRGRKTEKEGTYQDNQTKVKKIRTDKVHNKDEGKTVQLT
eukprot:13804588-Heterocapsa_arctica.AAC.1